MVPMLIMSLAVTVLGLILVYKDNELGPFLLGIGIPFAIVFALQAFVLKQKISMVREQTKNIQYLTSLDVADINKNVSHIKAHPFMYKMLNTDGIEYISLDGAGNFKVEADGK